MKNSISMYLHFAFLHFFYLQADEREQKARDYMRAEVGYIWL